MKKLFNLFLLFVLTFALTSCFEANTVPKVNKRDLVTLTSEEVIEKVQEFDLIQFVSTMEIDIKATMKGEQEGHVNVNGTVMLDEDFKLYAKLNLDIEAEGTSVKGKATLYKPEGNLIYADLDIKVKSTLGIAKVDVELKGNYKYDLTIMFGPDFKLDEIFGNPEQFDFSEIVNEPNFKETLDKMLEFTGLRFYERGSEFKIQLLLNKEIIEENQELIANSDMSSFIDEFLVNEENNIELVFVLKNNKISEVGFKAKVFVEEGDFEISYSAKSKVKMPKFPSFDDYEDFDIDSILSPFI